MTFSFYVPTFSNTLPIDSLSHSLFHLNIISSFILYHYLFFLYLFPTIIFFNEKCYIYNIFRNTFTTKFMWKVVTSSNLNSSLKLFFFSPILTKKNLLLKIYCENIMVEFLNYHFFSFLPFYHSYVSFLLFFSLDFSPPHTYSHISHPLPFCFLYFPLSRTSLSLSFSSSLSQLFFFQHIIQLSLK